MGSQLPTAVISLVMSLIPPTVWLSLRKVAASSQQYNKIQYNFMLQFKNWIRKHPPLTAISPSLWINNASMYLLDLIASSIYTLTGRSAQQQSRQHSSLRQSLVSRKHAVKRKRF